MLGAIIGDIIGSVYEAIPHKQKTFPLFSPTSRITDDTVLTVAVAHSVLDSLDYVSTFHEYVARYPNAGYGGFFMHWARSHKLKPYNSWGNGAAMRVSPIGWAYNDVSTVLDEARRSAEVTHDHPEAVKGAQATALSVFLARSGESKSHIRHEVTNRFGYDLDRTVDDIRPHYQFDVSCQRSVPESLVCFLDCIDFEDAVRNAVSLGGDADTMACIAGAVAEAYYQEIPKEIKQPALNILPEDLALILDRFRASFCSEF